MNLGAAYVQLGQYDLGIKWLQFSIKIDPDSIKAHRLLAGAIQLRDAYDRLSTRP
jgi:Tfp pilus assembly protein PilF